ncbi:tetratricopeptide repeat protein [Legionella dresdenensis]|uniref:Tetratricopeptide repeat protein n=1 Tax=Legionella dresdenensis TaxID=450200 RepID=A0ABV8CIF7_9GAMM
MARDMFFTKKKILITIFTLFGLSGLVSLAYHQARSLKRDPVVLMDRYYLLKKTHPQAAVNALEILLQQYPEHPEALRALAQEYLSVRDEVRAITLLEKLHHQFPEDKTYSAQLAKLYYQKGNWDKTRSLLPALTPEEIRFFHDQMASALPDYRNQAAITAVIPPEQVVINNLWNDYFRLKQTDPEQAQKILLQLEEKLAHNAAVFEEAGYFALQQGEATDAINAFLRAYKEMPADHLALQLGYLYMNQKEYAKAAEFFLLASQSTDAKIRRSAMNGYDYAKRSVAFEQPAPLQPKSKEMVMFDQYYELKKYDKRAAYQLLKQIIVQYPANLTALKEGGYLAIELKLPNDAINYFSQAYALSYEPDIAMQLGYLYNQVENNYMAYQYFKLAGKSTDTELALKAENAMTNLAGMQTKVFPKPYFSELFFTPFSQTRFGLTVRPLIARLGIEHEDTLQTKTYLLFRQTDDNKTDVLGQLPQIYEDNVRIMGAGVQITPVKAIPMVAFVETGAAYDLVYRNRNRWRGDLRGGLMYYQDLGARPAYFGRPTLSAKYYGFLYGDATYFSRYDNNVIGTLKTHQGIRLLQYHSSMLNLYMSGRVLQDTNRDFFNNIAEIGPGIGFIPSNRFFLEFRYEYIRGVYLPAGGSVNPYSKYYNNGILQMLFYVKM